MRNPSRRGAPSTGATRRYLAPPPAPGGCMDIAGSQSTYMLKALASLEGVRTMLGAFWNSVFRLALGVAG